MAPVRSFARSLARSDSLCAQPSFYLERRQQEEKGGGGGVVRGAEQTGKSDKLAGAALIGKPLGARAGWSLSAGSWSLRAEILHGSWGQFQLRGVCLKNLWSTWRRPESGSALWERRSSIFPVGLVQWRLFEWDTRRVYERVSARQNSPGATHADTVC